MQQGEHLLKYISNTNRIQLSEKDQYFYGHGKLLLSGEYFVLDGAKALGLPTQVGQSLTVKYSPSFHPKLYWKSYDPTGKLWFQATFEFWRFEIEGEDEITPEVLVLQNILRAVRKQNAHFLRDELDIHVETQLGFPLNWGLGSSSTLIHNIAAWAYVSPFQLLFNTLGGSGYDIACAQSDSPIFYQKMTDGPKWSPVLFDPDFKSQLYFIYLNKKQNSRNAIEYYKSKKPHSPEVIKSISDITDSLSVAKNIQDFNFLINSHEKIVGDNLGLTPVKIQFFKDFLGEVKSLGAWGGDFVLASSNEEKGYVEEYFKSHGHSIIIPYDELIFRQNNNLDMVKNVH